MSEFWFRIFYAIAWPVYTLIHPRRVVGRDKVPTEGCIFCGNHTRYSDPLFILFALGRRQHPYILGKAELLRIPVLGWALKKAGVIGVDRGKSDVKAIKECMRILRDGKQLIIFPEGTRAKEGEDLSAKTGAAMMALRTGVPVVPVYVPPRLGWFHRTTVTFGAPYYPTVGHEGKATAEDYQPVADDMLARIRALGAAT